MYIVIKIVMSHSFVDYYKLYLIINARFGFHTGASLEWDSVTFGAYTSRRRGLLAEAVDGAKCS